MPIAIISHPDCGLHDMGSGHPEQPARLSAIFDRLIASGLEMIVRQIDAPLATREQLERVHEPHYVQSVFDQAPTEGMIMLDPDTAMGPHTLAAALRAAGAVVHAVDLVMNREFQAVFCAVRPPGHHAERDRAMGFCFFNNVAVGAAHALAAHGLERVASSTRSTPSRATRRTPRTSSTSRSRRGRTAPASGTRSSVTGCTGCTSSSRSWC
jgi:acetoin utilization deacetylase AcuC-like enzyme